MNSSVTLDIAGMNRLRVELDKLGAARVRVGILGGGVRAMDPSGARHEASGLRKKEGSISRFDEQGKRVDAINNPTLGLIQEFGTKEKMEGKRVVHHAIPARSFLRMPLMTRLQTKIDEIGRGVWRAIVLNRGLMPALGALGTVARNLIDLAFETHGWGQWAPNTPFTIRKKGSSSPLIDKAQLRKSVTYQVVRGARG